MPSLPRRVFCGVVSHLTDKDRKFLRACQGIVVNYLTKFSIFSSMSRAQAFKEISASGSFDFIEKHYNVEHLLSFEDVIEDINGINAKMAT